MVGPHKSPLARIVFTIGDALGLETVAEGIETVEQLRYLQNLGCRVGQGFLFASPMEAEEVETLLYAQDDGATALFEVSQPHEGLRRRASVDATAARRRLTANR